MIKNVQQLCWRNRWLFYFFPRNVDYVKYKLGSNDVPPEISMSMKEKRTKREVIGLIYKGVDDLVNAIQEYNLKFKLFLPIVYLSMSKYWFFGKKIRIFHLFNSVDHGCYGLFHLYFFMLKYCGILFQSQKCEEVYGRDT